MADENTTPPEGTNEGQGAGEDVEDVVDRRQERDRRHRLKLESELSELKATAAEREADDRKAEEAKQREAGEFTKLESAWQTRHRDLEEKLEAANAKLEAAAAGKRSGKFLDAILEGTGVTNRKTAALVLPTLDLDDASPENFTEADARRARKALMKATPELFGGGGSTERKPPPGGGQKAAEKGSKEYFQQLAANMSNPGMSAAYERATGRGNTS